MKIQSITVEIHEKRNHPHEYGHYDARVSYTVEPNAPENPEDVVAYLQSVARQQVAAECDRWIADINRKQEIGSAKSDLDWMITRAGDSPAEEFNEERFNTKLAVLPVEEQAEYLSRLEVAKAQYIKNLDQALQGMIDRAKSRGLSKYERQDFEYALKGLPETERDSYRQRMEAVLSKPEAEQDKATKPEEEIPY